MSVLEFALFRNNFLHLSETFIHDELRFHKKYRGTVFARKYLNRDVYQGHEVFSTDQNLMGSLSPASLIYGLTGLYRPFYKIFTQRDFKLIHAHFGHNALYALPYAKKFKIPLIVSLHGRDVTILVGPDQKNPEFFYYTLRKNEIFKHATLFLAASSELKELAIEAGCPENKIKVHKLGIDISRFSPPDVSPVDNLVVMVGRFVAKKGFAFGIRAFAQAVHRGVNARMLIIGDGPLRGELTDVAEKYGVSNLIDMPGALPHDEVMKAMKLATAVITPSLVAPNMDRESGLIVAKEAQACGVPVLAHWHGGLPDIVADGKTGFLYPERDVSGMADGLFRILSNKDLRSELGKNARNRMIEHYDIIKVNEKLEAIYDEVISI